MMPFLRNQLIYNLRAAGMDSSDATVKAYFQRLGLWAGYSLGIYGVGFDQSFAPQRFFHDPDTLHNLDAAVAKGKGVVLVSPHLFGHEIAAATMHRRHSFTALVRESKDANWGKIKDRWYGDALGLETVKRPRKSSAAGDIAAMLRALRAGKVLGITPDVLTNRTSGMPVRLFNRTVHLSPGMILLAMRSGAPLITASGQWEIDPARPGQERARLCFSEPLEMSRNGDREAALREGLQRWCDGFEERLRKAPAEWLFWLDKSWTKILRQPAHGT